MNEINRNCGKRCRNVWTLFMTNVTVRAKEKGSFSIIVTVPIDSVEEEK